MTVREALCRATDQLKQAGVPDARLDAEYLLAELMRVSRLQLIADSGLPLPDELKTQYDSWLARRMRREPLQYILGTQPFMGHLLQVSPAALIPRADTEVLCEEAFRHLHPGMQVLDLCTGTGALAIALKAQCPQAHVTAVDISEDALALAEKNAAQLGVRVRFLRGDLFSAIPGERFHLIVSNPPYIPTADLPELQAEVRFEPALALDGGPDGLDFYRRIAREAPEHLLPGGWLLLEIGSDQAEAVCGLLSAAGFRDPRVIQDLSGLDRVITSAI